MLLEIQTGLRFTEVQVLNMRKCLLPTVRLAEAYTETLAKLLYSIDSIVNPIASRVSALPWPSASRGKSVITLRHQVTGSLSRQELVTIYMGLWSLIIQYHTFHDLLVYENLILALSPNAGWARGL